MVIHKIKGTDIVLNKKTAAYIETIKNINKNYVPKKEPFFIGPHLTTLYVILERHSPIREIYLTVKETDIRQKEIIIELEKKSVNWAFVENRGIDGREDLRFMNTYPLVWNYFQDNFRVIPIKGLPKECVLLHRRAPLPLADQIL